MIYTINTSSYNSYYKAFIKDSLKLNAFKRLNYFPMQVTEKLLDKYLKENYQMTLKYTCYLIILNCRVDESKEEIVVSMLDKKLDRLARIITFGTGKLLGSRIIPFIFGKLK